MHPSTTLAMTHGCPQVETVQRLNESGKFYVAAAVMQPTIDPRKNT